VALVVEADDARWEAVQAVKEQLLMSKANVLGILLNETQSSITGQPYAHYRDPVGTVGLN
jgi:hypothetical protein